MAREQEAVGAAQEGSKEVGLHQLLHGNKTVAWPMQVQSAWPVDDADFAAFNQGMLFPLGLHAHCGQSDMCSAKAAPINFLVFFMTIFMRPRMRPYPFSSPRPLCNRAFSAIKTEQNRTEQNRTVI